MMDAALILPYIITVKM